MNRRTYLLLSWAVDLATDQMTVAEKSAVSPLLWDGVGTLNVPEDCFHAALIPPATIDFLEEHSEWHSELNRVKDHFNAPFGMVGTGGMFSYLAVGDMTPTEKRLVLYAVPSYGWSKTPLAVSPYRVELTLTPRGVWARDLITNRQGIW